MNNNESKKLDIVFSCDKKYINPLISIINSIIKNASKQNYLNFNVVCDDDKFFYEQLKILKKHNDYNFTFNCVTLNNLEKN